MRGQPAFAGRPIGLCGVEVGRQVAPPRPGADPHQAVPPEQRARRARPGGRALPAAVVPEQAADLQRQVDGEVDADDEEQAPPPAFVAAQRAVQVERRAAVFQLFAGMPQPQVAQAGFGAGQHGGVVRQQVVGQDRRQVLGGRRGADPAARVGTFEPAATAQDARLPAVDAALRLQLCVEQRMDASVRGFLADEAGQCVVEGRAQVGRQVLRTEPHAVDEELLAFRKTERQRVEQGRAEGVAAVPVPPDRRLQVHQQPAHDERCHRRQPSALRALRNMRSHGLGAETSPPLQDICTLRNTRSACGIIAVQRPSAVVTAVRPPGLPLGLNG